MVKQIREGNRIAPADWRIQPTAASKSRTILRVQRQTRQCQESHTKSHTWPGVTDERCPVNIACSDHNIKTWELMDDIEGRRRVVLMECPLLVRFDENPVAVLDSIVLRVSM